jgi:hypothetical protein
MSFINLFVLKKMRFSWVDGGVFSSLTDDLNDVFVDDEELDEFL